MQRVSPAGETGGSATATVERIKRVGTALSLIGAPLLLTIGFAIHPEESSDGAVQLQTIADHAARWNAAHLLILAGTALFIPALLGLVSLLRGRGAWFGLIGAVAGGLGAVFLGALVGAEALATSAVAAVDESQRAALAPAVQAIIDLQGGMIVVTLGFALILGLLVIGIGLFVARVAARWESALVVLGSLILFAGIDATPVAALGSAFLLVGLGSIGLHLIRQTGTVPEQTAISGITTAVH